MNRERGTTLVWPVCIQCGLLFGKVVPRGQKRRGDGSKRERTSERGKAGLEGRQQDIMGLGSPSSILEGQCKWFIWNWVC